MPTIRTSTLLDRLAQRRADAGHIDALAADPAARFMLLVNGRALIRSNADRTQTSIRWLSAGDLVALPLTIEPETRLFLGAEFEGGGGRFAMPVRVPEPPPGEALHLPGLPGPLVDLRSLAMQSVMSPEEMSLIGQALMLAQWHDNARFCGRCGAPNRPVDGGWKTQCSSCSSETFPRIDPVVIMLIEDGRRCVLSREPRFPEGMVSTLAGFIEPGEDIFHAVTRETREEIGIETADVRFISSQPWPFPHSLMIGCIARAATTDLKIDPAEILEASGFEPEQVREMLTRRPGEGAWLPGRQSLANVLVRTWLGER